MKRFTLKLVLLCSGLIAFGCSSPNNDEYWPNPDNGDYVMVKEMIHTTYESGKVKNSDLVKINYDRQLNVTAIDYADNLTVAQTGLATYKYNFTYLKDNSINTITVDTIQTGNQIDVTYFAIKDQNNHVIKLNSTDTSPITYEYTGKNIVSSTVGDKINHFGYDNQNNLVKVISDEGTYDITYTDNKNAYIYSNINLDLGYIPGAASIKLFNNSKKSIAAIKNATTGEEIIFHYVLDDFGYPYKMTGTSNGEKVFETRYQLIIYKFSAK